MKRLAVELDDALLIEIKMEALRQGKSVKKLITGLVEEYLQTKKEQTR